MNTLTIIVGICGALAMLGIICAMIRFPTSKAKEIIPSKNNSTFHGLGSKP